VDVTGPRKREHPCSGRAPEAIANAIASGSATMPTTIPASKLFAMCFRDHNPAALPSSSAIIDWSIRGVLLAFLVAEPKVGGFLGVAVTG
jgi:hypothetical protein